MTGAASDRSIGWGIALALAQEGADIAVNDVAGPDALRARVETLEALGRRAIGVQADVRDPEQVEAMFDRAQDALGPIDIVVSNAGIIRWEHFLDITPQSLRDVIDVNIKGNAFVCQAGVRRMIASGIPGRLIITSSVQSFMQFPITPVYGASKRAMQVFIGALALELAPYGITVNGVAPGWVRSALNDPSPETQTDAGLEAQRRAVPLKRDGRIDEMGRAAVYLASADGDYITGTQILLDGGLGIGKYGR